MSAKGKVIQYVRYLCAKNFNALSLLLTDHIWAFSIALDGGIKAINRMLTLVFAFEWRILFAISILLPYQFTSVTLD
jgi:hypothetical protein